LDTIKAFFAASPMLAWSIVSIMIAMVSMVVLWEKIKWWWLNTWVSFPLIGRIAILSKDINRDTDDKKWFKAEKALCGDYKKFVRIQDEHDFNEKCMYLKKAGDNGRKPTPNWIWLLTVALVFVEAMGFSYVLAGYTLPGASENLQQTGAYAIAFVISILLVGFTHFAGHELLKSTSIKNARREWVESGRSGSFRTEPVTMHDPQSKDDGLPFYTQLANRVGTHASYMVSSVTLVLVVGIAVGATYVRGQVLEKTLHDEVVGKSAQINMAATSNGDGLNMANKPGRNLTLPDADVAKNQAAKDKALEEETNIDRHGGWGTFIVLAFVFVFLQILGVIFGYRWGFAGQNSADAYQAIGGGRYTTYADIREHYKNIADSAQAKLENLQQKLMERNAQTGTDGMHASKTFYDYMELKRRAESRDHDGAQQNAARNAAQKQQAMQHAIDRVVPVAASGAALTVNEALQQLDLLSSKDTKKDYIHTLQQPLQGYVLAAIKQAKEAESNKMARNQLDAELDGLL
jgi:hypothetical protein